MLAVQVKNDQLLFFKYHSKEYVVDQIMEQYEHQVEQLDANAVIYVQDFYECMMDLYIEEMKARQMDLNDVPFIPDRDELIRIENDEDGTDSCQLDADLWEMLGGYGQFANAKMYCDPAQLDFAKDIVHIMDEYQLFYCREPKADEEGHCIDYYSTNMIPQNSPIQGVW